MSCCLFAARVWELTEGVSFKIQLLNRESSQVVVRLWERVYCCVNATSACRNKKKLQQPAVAQWKVTQAFSGPVLVLPNV